jgi:hypothetical protein
MYHNYTIKTGNDTHGSILHIKIDSNGLFLKVRLTHSLKNRHKTAFIVGTLVATV